MNLNETVVFRQSCKAVIGAGWKLFSVHDGDDETEGLTLAQAEALANDLDECHVVFTRGRNVGWLRFIFANGNEGLDVLCDYTTCLDAPLTEINDAAATGNLTRYLKPLEALP